MGTAEETAPIDDMQERVSPGEFAPVGQCPGCGDLIECSDDDIKNSGGNVPAMVEVLTALGYTVVAP